MGQVRTKAKGDEMMSVHPEWAGKLSFVVVPDYSAPGCWDETFQQNDFDYVVHVAGPLLDNPANVDFDKFFLEPSVKGYFTMQNLTDCIGTRIFLNPLRSTEKM